jgi:hypothetical protein
VLTKKKRDTVVSNVVMYHKLICKNATFVFFYKVGALCCYACFTEVTQLRLLCEDDVPILLQQALPSEWNKGDTVLWWR